MEKTKYPGIYLRRYKSGAPAYYLRVTIRGKQTWRYAGDTLTAARELWRNYRQLRYLSGFGLKIPKRIKFEQLAEMYLDDYCKKPERDAALSNLPRVRSSVNKLVECFRGKLVADMTALDVDNAHLPRADLIMLKAILHRGKRWGFLRDVIEIRTPDSRKTGRAITPQELDSIIAQASPDHADAILLSLALGGMRLGELCKITRDNTNFESGTIYIEKRKHDRPKTYAMCEAAAAILRRRFLANGGVAFTEDRETLARRFFGERASMQGVQRWRFHDLRHTVQSWIENTTDVKTISEILGHADIKITGRYMHTSLEKQRAALVRINDYVREKIATK